ncbi:MAG: hypothetical protein M3P53_04740, partial [Actinomycetota bacterium]|nr:hypothetical protein [Actinomycetota bacterium]
MWEQPNLFISLESDWRANATRPEALAACRRWREASPVLAGLSSPAEVVARCHDRADRTRSAAILA